MRKAAGARAMVAVEEGGPAAEVLARCVAIQNIEVVMNPDAWLAQPAPLLPGPPQDGEEDNRLRALGHLVYAHRRLIITTNWLVPRFDVHGVFLWV